MLPADLHSDNFAAYPPLARALAVANLATLQREPLAFLPGLLRELVEYDYKFPAERKSIENELATLSALPPAQFDSWFKPFAQLSLSPKLEQFDWVNHPGQFVEQESAHLWTTHQLDAYRKAATEYGDHLRAATPAEPAAAARLGIAVVGQGVATYDGALFRNLREHGTHFTHVRPDRGLDLLLAAIADRAKAHPIPYAHWYVDGGSPADHDSGLTSVSWQSLEPLRDSLLKFIQSEVARPGMGPEELRTDLARLSPADLGVSGSNDPVLDRFHLKLFTEGSGTQIFSTTFAQWTAREALRRAQPLTLLVRFAPRQRQKPMNELLSSAHAAPELDPIGSLVDADMAAWYHWINQQRLSGSEQSTFLAWFEGHSQAVVIAPSLPRGTQSSSGMNLAELLKLASG